MGFLKWLIILIFQFYYLFYLTIAQPNFTFQSPCKGNETEYPPNGAYHTNLNRVLSSLSRNIDSDGFYNATIGQDRDRVSAIAQCRGDVELQTCRDCINNATRLILEKCPSKKSAFGIYDMCLIRYSNESFIGTMSTDPRFSYYVTRNFSNPQLFFNQYLTPLLTNLRTQASRGGKRKFAANVIEAPDFQKTHALVQCTADLSAQGCYDCLTAIYESLPTCECYAKWGNYHLMPSCIVRYEPYSFFNESLLTEAPPPLVSPPQPASLPPPPPGKEDKTARTVIIIVVPITTIVILIGCISVILMRRQKRKLVNKRDVEGISVDDTSIAESLQYDFAAISAATDHFSDANKLGQGGFGPVYKGKLPNGQEVAVKRLSIDSGQGDLEFKNEVMLVARLQHRNLVRLRGFCFDRTERLLVYEFVPNASLDQFLFDPVKRRQLDWERRSKIIGGVARGILYLHEDSRLRIIHRDLKASNVLLDAEMNPKISDFGMARLFTLDETQGSTTRIVGTYGYMAPEYAMHGQFSVKSDVFSFGVLLLEIVSGQKNTCFRNGESVEDLLSYAWTNWLEGTATNLIDPMFRGSSGLVRDIMRYIHIALLCVQENIADRPNMAAVVLMLSSLSLSLPVPSGPAYHTHDDINAEISLMQEYNSRSSEPKELTKNKSISSSHNEASITELYPR
ncbi:cysteine-rich receptor-like protein kinase 44 [Solanum dulcamara]|uniref:cysteine-rich receptor-like protein kinase 44 n=1 Tax=Solanum dulcamara TaxID=45834 RepID=UPI002485B3BE|nr:cysteine-rich receptor-like protein kinase 44 [Solanum dulcamara]